MYSKLLIIIYKKVLYDYEKFVYILTLFIKFRFYKNKNFVIFIKLKKFFIEVESTIPLSLYYGHIIFCSLFEKRQDDSTRGSR